MDTVHTCLGRSPPSLISILQHVIDPFMTVVWLFLIAFAYQVPFDDPYKITAIIAFLLALVIFRESDLHHCWRNGGLRAQSGRLMGAWLLLIAVLLFLGYATKSSGYFSRRVLMTWFVTTPILVLVSHAIVRALMSRFYATEKNTASVVIAGLGDVGRRMARQIREDAHLGMSLRGFFDDRNAERLELAVEERLLGQLDDVAEYVGTHKIDRIYVALPMMQERRITKLLEDLRDTTASIYFIPDIFIFDLIQARMSEVNGIPVVSLCETPFYGVRGLLKRLTDVVVASVILLLVSPLMILIGWVIKLDSPGPILFKQRRYGLDGEEIMVYKFRTMTVCEDRGDIVQAKRNDPRITRFGAFLRRTSLDELPQFINVLQGRMSVVGPRPHAIAHNEMYRKVIKGYMVRHKVRPGITGWAQVNGLRGETETLEKMQARIDYDLDYLRHWSVFMDIMIILRTVFLIFWDRRAY